MTSGLRQRKPAQQENEPAPQDSEGSDCPAGQPVRRVKLVDGSKFSHLGVTLGEDRFGCGVAILDCHSEDLVAASGLQASDVIVGINGEDVKDHGRALTLLSESLGRKEELSIEYYSAGEAKEAAAAAERVQQAQRSATIRTVIKLLLVSIVVGTLGAVVGYHKLDQPTVKDPVDMYLLPLLGYPRPEIDHVTGQPYRVVVRSSDPSRPWAIPGWDRDKEYAAVRRIKNLELFKDGKEAWEREHGDPMLAPQIVRILEQMRMTGGEYVSHIENMEAEMRQMRKDHAAASSQGLAGRSMFGGMEGELEGLEDIAKAFEGDVAGDFAKAFEGFEGGWEGFDASTFEEAGSAFAAEAAAA